MENPEFESFERSNGHDEFDNWLQELSLKDRAKMLQVITDAQEQSLLVAQRMTWVKKIDTEKNLYELRSYVARLLKIFNVPYIFTLKDCVT